MFRSSHVRTEDGGFLRCDRPAVARRQLEMSIGLVVVLLMATFVALLAMPRGPVTRSVATMAPFGEPAARAIVTKAAVRVIPIDRIEAADQKRLSPGG